MSEGVSTGLLVVVGIILFAIIVALVAGIEKPANDVTEDSTMGICINMPGLTKEDCKK